MSTLNLLTVELVSTLREAGENGPLISQDYNDSWTEALADLASLAGFINDILIPMLDGLSANIQPLNTSTPNGIEGRFIFSDTTDTTDQVFYDNLTNQSLDIASSLRVLEGIVITSQTAITNLTVEVTALQSQLSSTNQNDIAQVLQNFAASLASLTSQTISNTTTINNNLVTLQTNGVNNQQQNLLNLVSGSNITIVNSGGEVTISGAGATPTTPAGLTTEVQVNVAGAFYADSGFIYDHTSQTVTVGGEIVSPLVNATTGFLYNGTAPSGQFLRSNGTAFVSSPIEPGDVPLPAAAGSNTDVQINSSGIFYADNNFTYNHTTQLVTINGQLTTGTLTVDGDTYLESALLVENLTAATSIANQSSPIITVEGQYWTGSASASDEWAIQNILASGNNPISTLTISHTGSSGGGAVSILGSNGGKISMGANAAISLAAGGVSHPSFVLNSDGEILLSGIDTGYLLFNEGGTGYNSGANQIEVSLYRTSASPHGLWIHDDGEAGQLFFCNDNGNLTIQGSAAQNCVLSQVSVAGPTTTYTGVFPTGSGNDLAGYVASISGFSTGGNNVVVTILTSTSTTITCTTTTQMNETDPASAIINANTPLVSMIGSVWNGSAAVNDTWTIQGLVNPGVLQGQTLEIACNQSNSNAVFNCRLLAGGTAQTNGNVALSAGWGSGASAVISGVDSAFTLTITAGSASFSANPTFTVTFADGAFSTTPITICQQIGGDDVYSYITTTPSTTAPVFTWNSTPSSGATYIFNALVKGIF